MASRQQKQITTALVIGGLALAIAVVVLVLFLVDRGDEGELAAPTPTVTVTPEPSPGVTATPFFEEGALTPEAWTRCTDEEERYSIAYPEDWSTHPDFECRLFDRDPFEVEEDTELPLTDLVVDPTGVEFERVVDGFSENARVVSSDPAEVDRHRATVLETEATGDGLRPEGTRTYAYVINRMGQGFVVRTTVAPDDDDFTANTRIVDQAVGTLRFL